MRELTEDEMQVVAGGDFRLEPEYGGAALMGIAGVAVTVNPLLSIIAIGASVLLFGSKDDVNAIRDARSRVSGGGGSGSSGSSGGGIEASFNRTGGSKINKSS